MNITNADYFTFNVHNSIFLTGQTGSGKSHLVHQLIKQYEAAYKPGDMKYALFDLKQCEFRIDLGTVKPEYLLFDVQTWPNEQLFSKLEELADLSIERATKQTKMPFIFVYVEEDDLALADQSRFDKAIISINKNAKAANMKFIYSTSRPDKFSVSKELLKTFDLILTGPMYDSHVEYLGVLDLKNIKKFEFLVTER